MEIKQILEKEVFNVEDVKQIFDIGTGRAYKKMREIKSISDRIGISGRIHRKDYEDYINRDLKGEK